MRQLKRQMRGLSSKVGTSLVVQWLRLCAPNAGGLGSIPGGGTKIPHTTTKPARHNQRSPRAAMKTQHSQKKQNTKKQKKQSSLH